MPTLAASRWARRWGPEAVLGVLAGLMFLGFLGSVDLWGKREQRASAEAIDTIDHDHWLVARIQGRPRLEKPPLPRWTIATLMRLTGRRDEWMVRLPSALAALATVGLVYGLGRRLGGREVGLASGLALTSMVFFVSELRQAGNDGPLAFFTTLALYAAWRRLHGGKVDETGPADDPLAVPGARRWSLVMYAALGLGFLTKGPIIVLIVALTVVPYLALAHRLREGLRRLADGWGLLLFVLLALSWPVPVVLRDPVAARVWALEMGQKAGMAGIVHHRQHTILATEWPWMIAPWLFLAILGAFAPFFGRGRSDRPGIWFPWWWAIGNLVMFCFWSVAKPNYYLPCMPGMALLVGLEWVRLTRSAREPGSQALWSRRILQAHWVPLFAAALIAPVVASQVAPQYTGWMGVVALTTAAATVASAWAWRRGADAGAFAPLVMSTTVFVLIAYGELGPERNATRSHRALAATLERLLPPDEKTVMFFQQIDEGLWFYLRDRDLLPVPGSQPQYNEGFDLEEKVRKNELELDPNKRLANEKAILLEWINRADRASSHVLIRRKLYDAFAADPELARRTTLVYGEQGLNRNELILLRVVTPAGVR